MAPGGARAASAQCLGEGHSLGLHRYFQGANVHIVVQFVDEMIT